MATKPTTRHVNQSRTSTAPEDMSPADRLAAEILTARGDLLPSVQHIMNAGLDDDAAAAALTLFQSALNTPGDPNRDPRTAVHTVTGSKPARA